MKKSLIKLFSLSIIALTFFSCSAKNDYESLVNSSLQGQELLMGIINFEREHSSHFESKVDLAAIYYQLENYDASLDYCIRAESVINNAVAGKEGKDKKYALYRIRAQLEIIRQDYNTALKYLKKAEKVHGKKETIMTYLKAECYCGLKETKKALSIYDKTYPKHKDEISARQLFEYIVLLSKEERNDEALSLMDLYFSNYEYISEVGKFASYIYEKNGQTAKAFLCSFIDFEYHSNYFSLDSKAYTSDLNKNLIKASDLEDIEERRRAINLIQSRFDSGLIYDTDDDFVVVKYIVMMNKIRDGKFTANDMQSLLDLEKVFNKFPSYYWNCYKAFSAINPSAYNAYKPLLQRIILLGMNNKYIAQARTELGKFAGLNESQSQKILLPEEVSFYLESFMTDNDFASLEPIFSLLELSENDYELAALQIAKMYTGNRAFVNALLTKKASCSNRLKERIDYILN